MLDVLAATRPRGVARRVLASGLVDRLAAPHGIDRYLELVDPRWVVRDVRAQVLAARRRTPDTVTLTLRPTAAWNGFRAGQHVMVGVTIDGVVHERSFSLAGSPHRADGTLELTVRANPDGRVSRHLVAHARRGTVLRLSQARGDFVLPEPEDRDRHLLLVAGGSGVTPVLSMFRALADEGHRGPVTFLHYERTLDQVCYQPELAATAAALSDGRALVGLTREPGRGELDGHFGAEHLAAVTDDPSDLDVYVCGPPALTEAVVDHMGRLGLADRVHLERYGAPLPSVDHVEGAVTFERSATVAPAAGTLLETAEAAGLSPKYGCRRGICGTCTSTRTSGRVRDLVSGELSAADPGPVRLCVSVPCGDVAVDL